jgi:hypothetical protein
VVTRSQSGTTALDWHETTPRSDYVFLRGQLGGDLPHDRFCEFEGLSRYHVETLISEGRLESVQILDRLASSMKISAIRHCDRFNNCDTFMPELRLPS